MENCKYLENRVSDFDKCGDLKIHRLIVDSTWIKEHIDEFKKFWHLDACKVQISKDNISMIKNGYKVVFNFPICIEETFSKANEFGQFYCDLDTLVRHNSFLLYDEFDKLLASANLTVDGKLTLTKSNVIITINEKAFNSYHDDVLKTLKTDRETMFLKVGDDTKVRVNFERNKNNVNLQDRQV